MFLDCGFEDGESGEKNESLCRVFYFLSFTESKRNRLVIVGCGWLSEHRFTTSEDKCCCRCVCLFYDDNKSDGSSSSTLQMDVCDVTGRIFVLFFSV